MLKSTILSVLLFHICKIKGSRLLQQAICDDGECLDPNGICAPIVNCVIDPCTIDNRGCKDTQICTANYCGGCHAVCSCRDPNQCINPTNGECDTLVSCLIDPCSNNNGGCHSDQNCTSNYCGGCHAICTPPAPGDACGWPPADCTAYRCGCNLCPDGKTKYGCCAMTDGCTWEHDGECGLECSGIIPYDRACVGCDSNHLNHCIEYFDGCNHCICDEHGNPGCSEKFCAVYDPPKCTKCEEGYVINPTTNICEEEVGCGINHCAAYYDGCNWCSCGPNDQLAACTKRWCQCQGTPECTKCKFGYYLNVNAECVEKKVCQNHKDCGRHRRRRKHKGFRCEHDPVCDETNPDPLCASRPTPKVCVNVAVNSQCKSDQDCEKNNGFLCVGINDNGGVCVKYL